MGNNINIFNPSIVGAVPGSKKNESPSNLSFKEKLVLDSPAADFENKARTSAEKKARLETTLILSDAASSINKKEAATEEQLRSVDKLITLAEDIKKENNLTKAAEITEEAEDFLSSSNTAFDNASNADENLTQDEAIVEVIDSQEKVSNSEKFFKTTIPSANSLESYGLASDTSFAKENIDDTISSLEETKASIRTRLASFSSSRAEISNEVSSQAQKANILSSVEVVEDLSKHLAKKIISSQGSLLENNTPEEPKVEKLIGEAAEVASER